VQAPGNLLPSARRGCQNIGTGSGVSVREVLAMVQEVTGRAVPVRHRPAQPEPAALIADRRPARDRLGWQPTRSSLRQIITDAWQAEVSSAGRVSGLRTE
jgi:UDP-glucose 4-epimerase